MSMHMLLLLALAGVSNAEDNDDGLQGGYAFVYVESWSWAIFAIFMWLVPQLSIIVGDYRESLFNSKKWNVPTERTKTEQAAVEFYSNKKPSGDKTGSTMTEEEGPLYDKGDAVKSEDNVDGVGGGNDEEAGGGVDNGETISKRSNEASSRRTSLAGTLARLVSVPALQTTYDDMNPDEQKAVASDKLLDGMKAIRQSSGMALCCWLFFMVVAAVGISLGTHPLDERMVLVLEGLSRVFGAVVMSVVSFTIPFWSGLYFASYSDRTRNLGNGSLKELRFQVRWAMHRPLSTSFFLMLPFFEGVNGPKIPVSIISGIATGFIVDASVYFARRFESRFRRHFAIGLFAAIFGAASAFVLGDGAWFIATVWNEGDTLAQEIVFFSVAMGWFIVLFVAHMIRLFYSRHRRREMEKVLGPDALSQSTSANPTAAARPRMATSLIMGRMKGGTTSNAHDLEGTSGWESRRRTDDLVPQNGAAAADHLEGIQEDEDSDAEYDESAFMKKMEEEEEKKIAGFADEVLSPGSNEREGDNDIEEDDMDDEPTYREMFNNYTCCGCVRKSDKSWLEKTFAVTSWIVWWILVLGSLFVVAVNLGSTYQQEAARAKLPYVASILYDNMDEGPVCAFDNKGPESNITTFPDKEAAHAEGFLVVHCGECAACSDWHNLRLEYTTREYLAKESARCARKSLMGGADAVTSCLEKPPIGFQGQCAVCWTEDILCTKGFCAMIFLQSLMIDTVGNFAVGADTITSASCEEAHCEAGNPGDFVYCSGATRRRMNVTSSIARPGAQQCGIVDVEWADVFPE